MLSSFWSNFSILATCVFLTRENQTNFGLLLSLGAITGILHGYAYIEGIIGAENTPLFAYSFGFSLIQLIISVIAFYTNFLNSSYTSISASAICSKLKKKRYYLGKITLKPETETSSLSTRFADFLIFDVRIAFFSRALLA